MEKSKRVIAVYADSFNGKVGATLPYIAFAKLFGNPRLITADDKVEELLENCDMLLIPGGADVSSFRYKEAPHPLNSRANMHYEYMDQEFATAFIDAGKPIVGICRGLQTLNVLFGGSLHQHIIGHNQSTSRSSTSQAIVTDDGKKYEVNTMHHQAIKQLGKGLVGTAWAALYRGCPSLQNEEGITVKTYKGLKGSKMELLSIVEAFKHETLPILGFQWHPEEFNCEYAIEKIEEMLTEYYKN